MNLSESHTTRTRPRLRATDLVRISILCFVLCLPLAAFAADQAVVAGELHAFGPKQADLGPCPLKHTDVTVDIAGYVARVTLTQQFDNPFREPIEAVYTFPMSDRGAVDSMTMKIGDRVVKGIIKEREEARRVYEQAIAAGKTASLLDQERPNIFTQTVGNILPGSRIDITISYVETLKYEEGEYEFSFPMVVGPRYIPGNTLVGNPPTGTNQVPDAGRITPPITPEGTRAGHDISLEVRLDAGLPVHDIRSELHEVDVRQPAPKQAVVRLKNAGEIPNRDFVLKYAVAGGAIQDAVLAHTDARGGFFTLVLQPPDRVAPETITPKEMIFVIDCSGSMRGFPLNKAKETMRMCIEGMNPNDTFNLISFAGGLGSCFPDVVPNIDRNRRKALEYLDNLEGGGGTEMMPAIRASLEGQREDGYLRIVCFMTDGFIGNDMEILDAVRKNAGNARVFSFGIGNGVNRFLIDGMAREGRGSAEVVTLESDGDSAAERFHERIQSPLLTDITVGFGGLPVEAVYPDPEAVPDLFSSQPIILKGRYNGSGQGAITIHGNTVNGPYERSIPVNFPASAAEHDSLASLWARAKIDALMAQDWAGMQSGSPRDDVKKSVTDLGLAYSLVTQFTSFVAVEERVVNENGRPKTVQVPVEMTDGVSYEGIFGGANEQFQALGYLGGARAKSAPACMPAPMPQSVCTDSVALVNQSPRPPRKSQEAKEEAAKAEPKPEVSPTALKKLDPSLVGLEEKVNYVNGSVKVKNGLIEVEIELNELSSDKVQKLKNAGAEVIATRISAKKVMVRVNVKDLEKLVLLDFVVKIAPPRA